jgi:hypothetical protein
MNSIKQFLATNKISAHSLVGVWLSLVLAYSQVPAFHALVVSYYSHLPVGITQAITGLAPAIAFYWHTRKGS